MSTTKKGDELEASAFKFFHDLIEADLFWARKDCCRITSQKGFYSRDRDDEIIFDVAIEIFRRGSNTRALLVLIECKNYRHSVPVDDLEEFYTKALQVAPTGVKPILISSSALQSGALKFARAKGMGAARYFPASGLKWTLERSASGTFDSSDSSGNSEVLKGLVEPEYRSSVFELYMQSKTKCTNSLSDFFDDLVLGDEGTDAALLSARNPTQRFGPKVKYLGIDEIEVCAQRVLNDAGIEPGFVNLEELCRRLPNALAIQVFRRPMTASNGASTPLARISFAPPIIELYESPNANAGRERFTLAHELGHWLLGHGAHMRAEQCVESDLVETARGFESGNDIRRMEYQANYFASCLLMPREAITAVFYHQLKRMELRDKGFGPLYLDEQQCNVENFLTVSGLLMNTFGASREAVRVRLSGLKLLQVADQTKRPE